MKVHGPALLGSPEQSNGKVMVPEKVLFAVNVKEVAPVRPAGTVEGVTAASVPIVKSGATVTSSEAEALAGNELGDEAVIVNE